MYLTAGFAVVHRCEGYELVVLWRVRRTAVPLGNSISCRELGFRYVISGVAGIIAEPSLLLSVVYRLLRCLFGLLAVLVRSDLAKDAELLVVRHEARLFRTEVEDLCLLAVAAVG